MILKIKEYCRYCKKSFYTKDRRRVTCSSKCSKLLYRNSKCKIMGCKKSPKRYINSLFVCQGHYNQLKRLNEGKEIKPIADYYKGEMKVKR